MSTSLENELKSQIGLLKTTLRLTELGYVCFAPIGEVKHPIDLIGFKDKIIFTFQVKYRSGKHKHKVPRGNGNFKYEKNAFDFYAFYIPQIDKVIFLPFEMIDKSVLFELPKHSTQDFYWYEDFLTPNKTIPPKRKPLDFGVIPFNKGKSLPHRYKQPRPDKNILQEQILSMPITSVAKIYNMSDNGINRWIKDLGLTKPTKKFHKQ